jgi:hypothetical protein
MSKFNRENKLDLDLISLREKAHNLPLFELDRDVVEISIEIEFLEIQVECDLGSYTPKDLLAAYEKISHYKQKAEILKTELANRSSLTA